MFKITLVAGVLGLATMVGTSAQATYTTNADGLQAHSAASVVLALNPQPLPPGEKKNRIKKRYPVKRHR